MTAKQTLFLFTILAGTAAFAHQGVQNPAVLARMDGMSAMKSHLEVIGDTAKGKRAFDQAAIARALEGLEAEATRAQDLFRLPEQDPKSESLPVIWETYDDFSKRLESLSEISAARPNNADELRPLLVELGTNCKSCHDQYRK